MVDTTSEYKPSFSISFDPDCGDGKVLMITAYSRARISQTMFVSLQKAMVDTTSEYKPSFSISFDPDCGDGKVLMITAYSRARISQIMYVIIDNLRR